MGIMVSWLSNVLWRGLEPVNSFSGARDYACSAVTSWTTVIFNAKNQFRSKKIREKKTSILPKGSVHQKKKKLLYSMTF